MTVGAGPDPDRWPGGSEALLASLRRMVDDPATPSIAGIRTSKIRWLLDRIAPLEQALVAAHESNQDYADEIVAAHAERDVERARREAVEAAAQRLVDLLPDEWISAGGRVATLDAERALVDVLTEAHR